MNDGGALGVILARAGSKGLPNKNSMTIAGKPMLAWTIEHALLSKKIKRVLVTTDGEALAQIAGKYDVEVIRRPAELASDTATIDAAARHAVNQVVDTHDNVCLLYGNVINAQSVVIRICAEVKIDVLEKMHIQRSVRNVGELDLLGNISSPAARGAALK